MLSSLNQIWRVVVLITDRFMPPGRYGFAVQLSLSAVMCD